MSKIIGVDCGTMNIVSASTISDGKVELKTMRNMFLPVEPDQITSNEISNTDLDYVEQKDSDGEVEKIYILSEDAFRFSQIFGKQVRRCMSKGVISSTEIDALDVLTLMIEKLVGKTKNGSCTYSIPASPIDVQGPSVIYHEKVFDKIFRSIGYTSRSLNESMAIIFSECQKENFSGIGISFGAGMTNICCAYKGTPTLTFSVARGGDWIDEKSAQSTNTNQSRVTSVKEKNLDLQNSFIGKKREKRVREALVFYYQSLIEYVLKHITDQFEEASDGLSIDEEIPIVISGGTSCAIGFIDLFKDVFTKYNKDFPYDISEIRHAEDPMTSVAQGCLMYGMWMDKKDSDSKNNKKIQEKKNE